MKVLITGKHGQLARCLDDCAAKFPMLSLIFAARSGAEINLDLEAEASLRLAVQTVQPNVIINAAAYTQVDRAEDEPEAAMQINGVAPGILAEEANKCGAVIIQISTDYVFDGTSDHPYKPTDQTNPTSTYGASKLKGELAVSNATDDFITIRTAWVYSSYGKNFYKKMLSLAQTESKIEVVDDQIGNPTHAHDLALRLLGICKDLRDGDKTLLGTVQHFVGPDEMTWFDFARQIFVDNDIDCIVKPTTTDQMKKKLKLKANRPANSRLTSTI